MQQVQEIDKIVSEQGLPAIRLFFEHDSDSPSKDLESKAQLGLKLAGIAARRKSADTNAVAVKLKVAKEMGKTGNDLDPIWREIGGGNVIEASGEAVGESKGSLAEGKSITSGESEAGNSVARSRSHQRSQTKR